MSNSLNHIQSPSEALEKFDQNAWNLSLNAPIENPKYGFDVLKQHLAKNRTDSDDNGRVRVPVVLISDLDDLANIQQRNAVLRHSPGYIDSSEGPQDKISLSEINSVKPYNEISAAHHLAACLGDHVNFPAGSVFVITVDPHVGQNDEKGQNVADKRCYVQYSDGTVIIGPARSYVRVGEFHNRGHIEHAVEIDIEKLKELGFVENEKADVFDGLRRFAPAASAIINAKTYNPFITIKSFGDEFDPNEIPALKIPEGTITDIEPNYQNIRLELDQELFSQGSRLAISDKNDKLLAIAKKTDAFTGEKGAIVAANGSKKLICNGAKKTLYLAAVQGHLGEILSKRAGRSIEVGEKLKVKPATNEEIVEYEILLELEKIYANINRIPNALARFSKDGLVDVLKNFPTLRLLKNTRTKIETALETLSSKA
ncbi:hypothetical protein GF340_01765 [Candidatus Peregrinibacteria bacterium]|nr:hypothetical protein [Candidatus Peregrinibacteria bacterium]